MKSNLRKNALENAADAAIIKNLACYIPMTSQSLCSLSVNLRDTGLIGTSGRRLTGFNGVNGPCVGVFVDELPVLSVGGF